MVSISPASVTVTPSATSIYTNDSLTLTGQVVVAGGTPLGSLTVSGGGYTGYAFLSGATPGQYSLTIPPGTLNAGTDVMLVTYNGSTFYTSASTSTTVSVNQFLKITPTLTITPASTNIDAGQQLEVTVVVTGTSGQATGSVTLTSGSYSSGAVKVTNGSATVFVPANTLSVGTDSIDASYSGGATYLSTSGIATITAGASTYTLSASAPPSIAPGGAANSTITVDNTAGYAGTITASCALTGEPNGATDLPVCTMQCSNMIQLHSGVQNGYFYAGISTTAATAKLDRPILPGRNREWSGLAGTVLALVVFFGIPARRRNWRSLVGVVILLAVLGCLGACGRGSAGGSSGGGGNSGTRAGTYTFTVTAAGNPTVAPVPTVKFTVTVN